MMKLCYNVTEYFEKGSMKMTILGIDTSNQSMSLCLADKQQIIGTYMTTNQKNHSTTLMPAIDFLMSENGKKPKELSRIIVAEGPGSYTGLRIGVTTAKTLAWSLNIDLYALSTLALIAAGKTNWDGLIVPLVNARRENVYTAAYRWQEEELITITQDQHISFRKWAETLLETGEKVFFIGLDVPIFNDIIESFEAENFFYETSELNNLPQGEAFMRLLNQARLVEDVESFNPNYLKKVEAEEKWLETHQALEDSDYVKRV